jgi:hypothetical protein
MAKAAYSIVIVFFFCLLHASGQTLPIKEGEYKQTTIPGYEESISFNGTKFEKSSVSMMGKIHGKGLCTSINDTLMFMFDSIPSTVETIYKIDSSKIANRPYKTFKITLQHYENGSMTSMPDVKFSVLTKQGNTIFENVTDNDGKITIVLQDGEYDYLNEIKYTGPGFSKHHYFRLPKGPNNVYNVNITFLSDTGAAHYSPHVEKYVVTNVSTEGFKLVPVGASGEYGYDFVILKPEEPQLTKKEKFKKFLNDLDKPFDNNNVYTK